MGEELGDGTNLVFVDLFGFSKKEDECETLEDFWMYSIKNMWALESCPERAKGEAEGSAEVIQLLHAKGMTIEQIAGLLDVDPKGIEDLL